MHFENISIEENAGSPSFVPKCEVQKLEHLLNSMNAQLSKPQRHDYYLLIWVSSGTGSHYVDFEDFKFDANTILLVSPGQVHYFHDCNNVKGWVVNFYEDSFLYEDSKYNDLIKHNVYEIFDSFQAIKICADPWKIAQLFMGLQEEIHNDEAYAHYDMVMCLLKILLIQIGRSSSVPMREIKDSKTANKLIQYAKFRRVLECNYSKIHSVSGYAELMGLTHKALSGITQDVVGQNPLRVINNRIVLEAKRQLVYSSMTVKEIAYVLGFTDVSHFTKIFSASVGVAPLQFRESYKPMGLVVEDYPIQPIE